MEIYKEFHFEAAHYLPRVPPGHQCSRLHGHSYRVWVHVIGHVDPDTGWVRDFADISAAMAPVLADLDHRNLNDIDGLENPTSERLSAWIWERIASLPGLDRVVVAETASSGCVYRGPSSA